MLTFKSKLLYFIILISFSEWAHSLVGSKRAGRGWEAIVYIEFTSKSSQRTPCTGFLINSHQAITVGHCAIHDESKTVATSASVCIGKQKPFSKPGEGCFQSKQIRFAKNYLYNSQSDMVIIDLAEKIPLNFLGIKPLQPLSGNEADILFSNKNNYQNKLKMFSFGSRNFNAPTLGRKGVVKANNLKWDTITGLLKASSKGNVFGSADDGAGLLVETPSGWKLVGLLSSASPDFFVSVQAFFDPCLPPEPAAKQPDIKLTSSYRFVSINKVACNNSFFKENIKSSKICNIKPLSKFEIRKRAKSSEYLGQYAFQMYLNEKSKRGQLKWLNIASNKNHSQAMLLLANLYKDGKLLRKNKTKETSLISKSALLGNLDAQYSLSQILADDEMVKPIVNGNAKHWLLKAAENGHAEAQYQYAQSIANNNWNAAYDWLMRSARQGFAPAQYQLGVNYYNGHGVKRDRYIGYQWIEFAEGQGFFEATSFLSSHPQQSSPDY